MVVVVVGESGSTKASVERPPLRIEIKKVTTGGRATKEPEYETVKEEERKNRETEDVLD